MYDIVDMIIYIFSNIIKRSGFVFNDFVDYVCWGGSYRINELATTSCSMASPSHDPMCWQ